MSGAVWEQLQGGLIVSCQAYPGEPMRDSRTMAQVAESVVMGGAVGVRAQGLGDLRAIRERISVPLIGLVKAGESDVYITPTLADCLAVAATGCDIVALDGTRRRRPDGLTLAQTIEGLMNAFPQVQIMADCGSAADAAAAQEAGADILGTTLAGYTGERSPTEGPDWECLDEVLKLSQRPVIAEGRFHTPAQAAEALRRGASAVVVGTAITHPARITRWFADAVARS